MILRRIRGSWGKLGYGFITGLIVFAAVWVGPEFSETGRAFMDRLERGITDQLFQLREPEMDEPNPYVSDRIRLVAFDEDSMSVIGKWPWKRYVHAGYLEKLQRFKPRSILVDLILVDEETAPDYLLEASGFDDSAKEKLVDVFQRMDLEMAAVLSLHSNVYLDVQMMNRPREGISEEYIERIVLNEEALSRFALKVEGGDPGGLNFNSLEPVISEFVTRMKPSLINVPNDPDNKVRRWPLYYKYDSMTRGTMYLPSSVLLFLCDLYYTDKSGIMIKDDGTVVVENCKVASIDDRTRKTLVETVDFEKLQAKLKSTAIPFSYKFDANLRAYLINSQKVGEPDPEMIPEFALPVLEEEDGWRILGRWEVFSAARELGSKKIRIIRHSKRTIELPTVTVDDPPGQEGCFYINYNGREGNYFQDPVTGLARVFSRFPTSSYQDIYMMPELPPIPKLDGQSRIITNSCDLAALELWFFQYCGMRAEKTEVEADMVLGEQSADPVRLLAFLNERPRDCRFFLYREYMVRKAAAPGMLWSLFADYPAFAKMMGQDARYHLSEQQIVESLLECYRLNYERFYDQLVFTGGNTIAIGDVQQTPYGPMFGIHVIMNALSTLATDNLLTRTADIKSADFKLLLGFCLIAGIAYAFISARFMWVLFLVSVGALFGSARLLFENHNTILSLTPLLIGDSLTFVGVMIWKIMTEERDKRYLHKTFGAYLAPEVISDMYKKQAHPTLGGETRRITAYFTDIAAFSSFSEQLSPEHLLELLNAYLTEMTSILTHEKGTLDKYIGDAIVAFFGAPGDLPDHGLRACMTALKMQKKLQELRNTWEKELLLPGEESWNTRKIPASEWEQGRRWPKSVSNMQMRIGLNAGDIVVGNMGSSFRMNYTMMGDAVNLAARLESACKQYGVFTLASETVLNDKFIDGNGVVCKVSDIIAARYIDRIIVAGRTQPVTVFEPIGLISEISPDQQRFLDVFHKAISRYLAMEWDEAIELFQEALKLEPDRHAKINPSILFIQRCRDFKQNGPELNQGAWDGVFRLTRK